MGFGSFIKAVGKEYIKTNIETLERNKDTYDRTTNWAYGVSDETLKKRFKTVRDQYEKKAIYDELKRRGY